MVKVEEPQVVYRCQECRGFFPVPPRSRRRFCFVCDRRRRQEGWRQRKGKTVSAE